MLFKAAIQRVAGRSVAIQSVAGPSVAIRSVAGWSIAIQSIAVRNVAIRSSHSQETNEKALWLRSRYYRVHIFPYLRNKSVFKPFT